MQIKILEVRDAGTMFGLMCIDMNPGGGQWAGTQKWFLKRAGYPCDGKPNIAITHLNCNGSPCSNDPYYWKGRTYPVAHKHIIENWESLRDGDVIDVEHIMGLTTEKKKSERFGG